MSVDRIEIVYGALDEMALAIKNKEGDDPERPGLVCSWPETFLAWKSSVKARESQELRGRSPLTDLQWSIIELYMTRQHGFPKIIRKETTNGHPLDGS